MDYRDAQNIEELRALARRRLPKIAWDFLDGGAEDNLTLDNNRDVFRRIRFRPHTLIDVSKRSAKTTVFGKPHSAPFGIAPTGAAGLYGFKADSAMARAARDAGLPFVLSTASFEPLEDVARAGAGGTLWFQLYMSKDREAAARLVNRARDAGYSALIVTTDVPLIGNREPNLRNGWQIPFKLGVKNMIDGVLHPHWLVNTFFRTLLDSGVPRFQNTDVNVGGRIITTDLGQFRSRRDALDWSDFQWLREIWTHKFFIKGVLQPEDARMAVQYGAGGVFVSNHGGRQLDGAQATIDVLPEIRAAVGKDKLVMFDGGIRRGSDVVKAIALGADMAFAGRAPLYGVAAGGEAGVAHALGLLKSEVDRVLALIGCPDVKQLGPQFLARSA